jgi:hypothetical protein
MGERSREGKWFIVTGVVTRRIVPIGIAEYAAREFTARLFFSR